LNLEKLVGSHVTKHEGKKFLCRMCLSCFYSEGKLIDHETYCVAHKSAKIIIPKFFDNIIQFKNYIHSLKIPFVTYTDFECMLQNIHTCQPSYETAYTNAYEKHTPTNFAYYIKYCNGDFKTPVEYSGPDAPKVFYEKLKEDALYIAKKNMIKLSLWNH